MMSFSATSNTPAWIDLFPTPKNGGKNLILLIQKIVWSTLLFAATGTPRPRVQHWFFRTPVGSGLQNKIWPKQSELTSRHHGGYSFPIFSICFLLLRCLTSSSQSSALPFGSQQKIRQHILYPSPFTTTKKSIFASSFSLDVANIFLSCRRSALDYIFLAIASKQKNSSSLSIMTSVLQKGSSSISFHLLWRLLDHQRRSW